MNEILVSPDFFKKLGFFSSSVKIQAALDIIAGSLKSCTPDTVENTLEEIGKALMRLDNPHNYPPNSSKEKAFVSRVEEIIKELQNIIRRSLLPRPTVTFRHDMYWVQAPGYSGCLEKGKREPRGTEIITLAFAAGNKYPITSISVSRGDDCDADIVLYAIGGDGREHAVLETDEVLLRGIKTMRLAFFK